MAAADLGRVKTVFGSRQVEDAIRWAKQKEQPKKETSVRKRLEQAKENVEIRENGKHNKKSKSRDMER